MTGLDCSTQHGTGSTLESRDHPQHRGDMQFRCACVGKEPDVRIRDCEIHIWECPKVHV